MDFHTVIIGILSLLLITGGCGEDSKWYLGPIKSDLEYEGRNTFLFPVNASKVAIQISVRAQEDHVPEFPYPVVVTSHWMGTVEMWPISVTKKHDPDPNNIVRKILWREAGAPDNVTLFLSSYRKDIVSYELNVTSLDNFYIDVDAESRGTATLSSALVYKLNPPESWDYAFFTVLSDTDMCAKMSIQQPKGSQVDIEPNPDMFQTFTRKAALTVNLARYPNGLLFVVQPTENDKACATYVPGPRQKNIQVTVRNQEAVETVIWPILFPILVFVLVATFNLGTGLCFKRHRIQLIQSDKPTEIKRPNRIISKVMMSEFSDTIDKSCHQSRRYIAMGFMTAFFYTIPAFQLLIVLYQQAESAGNWDLCYFNQYCSYVYKDVQDVNHLLSNCLYMLLGLLYLWNVYARDREYKQHPVDGRGVAQHFGIHYCQGFGFAMTGLLSLFYHVCPNRRNFMFDIVFMYQTSGLSVITFYQNRRATYIGARFTFAMLAFAHAFAAADLWLDSFTIKVMFSVVHAFGLICMLPKITFNGYIYKEGTLVLGYLEGMGIIWDKIKDDWANNRMFRIQKDIWMHPQKPSITVNPNIFKYVIPFFLVLVNGVSGVAMWLFFVQENLAIAVLFVFVTNSACYTVFYFALKFYHGEARTIGAFQPAFYLNASFFAWGVALIYYFNWTTDWNRSPALSRLVNQDCHFLGFYDNHDLWHFWSALGIFCTAMQQLTVDDDLVDQLRSTIPVF